MTPTGAKVEVSLLINPDQWDVLKNAGYTDDEIKEDIAESITLRAISAIQPVMDIEGVSFQEYYQKENLE